ncbi:hypothetical protein IQ06DRAFT_154717 [Phaeosphaeriaceae sp. SRC1lsM3a]|nr:hypothetical protein IQ06DRAFT_154717 [Stagonospora sp. SRC1lsM3a]
MHVRRCGGLAARRGRVWGAALEASAVQSQLNGANAVQEENAHTRWIATGKDAGLRSTWETDACRDRSSLVLGVGGGCTGVGEDGELAGGASRRRRGSGRAAHAMGPEGAEGCVLEG